MEKRKKCYIIRDAEKCHKYQRLPHFNSGGTQKTSLMAWRQMIHLIGFSQLDIKKDALLYVMA
jgi:hypothetical protein